MPVLLILLFWFPSTLSAQFDAGRWAVRVPNTPVYTESSSHSPIAALPYGYPLKAKGQKQGRVSFVYNNREVWLETNLLIKLDFSIQNFSSEDTPFIPAEIQGNDFSFIFKNAVYRLDLAGLDNPKLAKLSDAPRRTGAYFSSGHALILLTGSGSQGLNIALLSTAGRKFAPLTVFAGDASLVSAEFSADNAYAALHISIGEEQNLLVFRTDTGMLTAFLPGIQTFRWAGAVIAAAKKSSVVLLNPEGSVREIYSTPKNKELQAVFSPEAGEFLMDLDGTVYRLGGGVLEKTDYASIERSGMFQRYEKNGEIILAYGKNTVRNLSGKSPRWDFVSFAGPTALLYNAKSATGAITTLYYYNAEKNESLPYRWIEEPAQVLSNGLAYEAVEDKGEIWIFLEQPGGKARMLRLNELLE